MKILIVEDNADSRVLLERALQSQGYTIESASNGVQAFEKVVLSPPDLIISDIMMPEMDGFELCRRIKTDRQFHAIPLVFYTATYTDKKDEELAMSLGASRFLIKPMELEVFLNEIREVIEEYKASRLPVPEQPRTDEKDLGRMQTDVLARKLDKKVRELEEEHKELRRVHREREDIFQAIGHSILILDLDNNILSVNKATIKATGAASEGELIGRKCYEVFHRASSPPAGCPFVKILSSGRMEQSEMEVEALGGTFLVSCTPVFDEKGNIQNIIHIATDITNLKNMQRKLEAEKTWSEAIVGAAPNIIVGLGEHSEILLFNKFAEKLTGYAAEEVIGKSWIEMFIPTEMRPQIYGVWDEIVKNKLIEHHYVNPIITKEGGHRRISWSNTILTEEGRFRMMLSVGEDITERKLLEDTLRESERFLENVVENIPNMIFVKDSKALRFVRLNKAGEELLGFSRDELIGKNDYDLFPKEEADFFTQKDREVLNNKQMLDVPEETIETRDKGQRIVHTKKIAISDESGNPAYLLGISEDITERKLAEDALRSSETELHDSYFAEAIINMILRESLNNIPLEEILQKSLNMLLSIPWVAFEPVGSIYLVEDEADALVLAVQSTISESLNNPCRRVLFGQCLCGKAAQNQKILFDSHMDEHHDICCEGIQPHGHYIVPILYSGKTLGVINICLKKDYRENPRDKEFLLAFADTMAVILMRNKTEQEKNKIQGQLVQSQKMEVVGQLAGGIAHDFNNILTALIGYGHLLKMKMNQSDPLQRYTDHILSLSDRAANLTQSLLTFSRKQVMDARPVDLNDIVKKVEYLLSRVIGEDIHLETTRSREELIVMADPGHVEQMLMNLSTNARDAMPEGGTLTIRTETLHIDSEFIREHGFGKPGDYAVIICSDTGVGMDRETRGKIFDPFFTTKEVGKGTGLGLAMVYGITKQHNGYINVYSEPGQGTTFRIYLPLIQEHVTEKQSDTIQQIERGTETILLAEDEAEVREFTRNLLTEYGYKVITAADGQEAINQFITYMDKIQLVMLDVIMSKKNGREAFNEIKQIKPDVKVIFISGYPADIIRRRGMFDEGLAYIEKPISPFKLLSKIREVLTSQIC